MSDQVQKESFELPVRGFKIIDDGMATLPLWLFLKGLQDKVEEIINIQQLNGEFMGNLTVITDSVLPTDTSVTTLYTAPTYGSGTRIQNFVAHNTSAGAVTYDVYIVPSGESNTVENRVLSGDDSSGSGALAANQTKVSGELIDMLMPAGASLQVVVSNSSTITFRGHGIEF